MGAGRDAGIAVAGAAQERMHRVAQHNDQIWNELATYQSDASILTATGLSIPKGQYRIAYHLQQPPTQDALVGYHDDVSGFLLQHNHLLWPLNPGDTVVVAWVDGGSLAVVIAQLGPIA